MNLNEFDGLIVQWAEAKRLTSPDKAFQQYTKLGEEFGELGASLIRWDREATKDAIGDCMVVLAIIAKQYNLSLNECAEFAWNQIKDRTGNTINGVFLKDEKSS